MLKDWKFWAAAAVLILGMALLLSPFASQSPDGLEKVAKDKGFKDKAQEPPLKAPFPDYELPQKGKGWGGAVVKAGGVMVVLAAGLLLGLLLRSKKDY